MRYKITPIKVKPGVSQNLNDNDNPTFTEWLERVNKFLLGSRGIDLRDLPDQPFKDWYKKRVRPIRAANKVISVINKTL